MQSKFCIEGDFHPPCKQLTFYEFPEEKDVIVLILEYFKRFLPQVLSRKTDYYNRPIVIDPKDIDLVRREDYGDYLVLISITDDNSTYPDDRFMKENTEYAFQIELQATGEDVLASLENLMKLKSAVKTMLVNMDNNLNLITTIGNFAYEGFGIDESNKLVRQGIYTFSVQADNFRK